MLTLCKHNVCDTVPLATYTVFSCVLLCTHTVAEWVLHTHSVWVCQQAEVDTVLHCFIYRVLPVSILQDTPCVQPRKQGSTLCILHIAARQTVGAGHSMVITV